MKVFCITGTHEQAFDRMVAAADRIAARGHEVFVQYGYASSPPTRADGAMWVERDDLQRYCRRADVIITHGGPGSIWDAFDAGKIPIVVPRSRRHGEHVDDHQIAFGQHLARNRRVILVEDTDRLDDAVERHRAAASGCVVPSEEPAAHRRLLAEALEAWGAEHMAARRRRRT